jgi:gamma-tubulin complex component 2
MQSQGLYKWLLKIVSRTGSVNEDGELDLVLDEREDEKKPEQERTLLGECKHDRR